MSIIGSVLGWPLLAMPSTPGPRTVEWSPVNVVSSVPNPYTGREQIQDWQAGWWTATVTMPPMARATAAAWLAFITQCRGQSSVFYFGDTGMGAIPQGTAEGLGVTDGSFQQPYLLTTTGWDPNQVNLLLPGDWVQVGYRLYQCQDTVSSDGAGNASFAIWPQIREQPATGSTIATTNAQGLFRLARNSVTWSESYNRTYTLSFQIREAI